jgi:hypothetical protein
VLVYMVIMGAPWYVNNLQLHSDLEVSYLVEHIRNLAQSFESKIPDSENLVVQQMHFTLEKLVRCSQNM